MTKIDKVKVQNIIELNYKNWSKNLFYIGLSGIKSFFFAITQVAWGISGIFIMGAILRYYQEKYEIGFDVYISTNFAKLTLFVTEHIMLFFFIFWIYSFISNYRSIK